MLGSQQEGHELFAEGRGCVCTRVAARGFNRKNINKENSWQLLLAYTKNLFRCSFHKCSVICAVHSDSAVLMNAALSSFEFLN